KETELARKITRSATRAARLIDQLLDLTRSRLGGGIPVTPRRFDLTEVCLQVVGESETAHPDRAVQLDVLGDATGVWDRDRLAQLLSNLVGNAVQHGEPRSPIRLLVQGEEAEVVVDVASRGRPIPPETLPFIFDAFRRGRTAQVSRPEGLGLGLFISQEI